MVEERGRLWVVRERDRGWKMREGRDGDEKSKSLLWNYVYTSCTYHFKEYPDKFL